jgi:N utilization substance protein B
MQLLYQYHIGIDNMANQSKLYLESSQAETQTQAMALELATGAWGACEQSDSVIREYSLHWDIDRITMVDRAIMRLALYEINALDTPNVVVVDEAIELSKRFSTQDAAKFINGILGAYIKSLDTNHV